jgi:hypothetical protein
MGTSRLLGANLPIQNVRFSNRPLGSSAFKLSTTAVSTSLAGSRWIRGRGGTISNAVLPPGERQLQADMRTHLIHRPARDSRDAWRSASPKP